MKLKTAVIGLGIIGNVHLSVLTEGDYDVVGVCDILPTAIEKTVKKHALKCKTYTDWKEMILSVKPDVVHICTPHYLHAEMILFALENDVNVLCEKPICISYEQMDAILVAEKKSKAKLGVSFQNRYNAPYKYAKEYLKNKKIIAASAMLAWCRDERYYGQAEWRGKWETEGGGVLINQAIHTIDFLQWVVGFPEYVTAFTDAFNLKDVIEVEDTASAIFSNGEINYSVFATNCLKNDTQVIVSISTADGESVTVYPEYVVINGKVVETNLNTKVYAKACYGMGHTNLFNDFYDCVKNDKPFALNGAEAMKAIRMVLSIYQSKGKKIKIK